MRLVFSPLLVVLLLAFGVTPVLAGSDLQRLIEPLVTAHPGRTGTYVLGKGEDALLARAWLVDHASKSIEVQYFIWSSDNIGTLASES